MPKASNSQSDVSAAAILEGIQSLRADLTLQISQVNNNVEDLKKQISGVNKTVEAMQVTLGHLGTENEKRKTEYETIVKENWTLREEVSKMKDRLHDLEQYSRKDNIEIVGVPFTEGEDLYAILKSLAKVLQLRFSNQDVSTVHRLQPSAERPNPTIIVRFVTRNSKEAWIAAAREHRRQLTAGELNKTWPSTWVYINDHLTPYNKSILGRARRLVKEQKIAFAWSRDCRVFARKTAAKDCPVKVLRCWDDLDQLLQN